jgi:hypothetical protein
MTAGLLDEEAGSAGPQALSMQISPETVGVAQALLSSGAQADSYTSGPRARGTRQKSPVSPSINSAPLVQ